MDTLPRVLLVEDEPALRRELREQLEGVGFSVEAEERGLVALQRADAAHATGRPFDAVVTGLLLPDLGGLKLLHILKSRHPSMVVMVVSAFGRGDTAETVAAQPGCRFFPRPVSGSDLEAAFGALSSAVADVQAPAESAAAYLFVKLADDADPSALFMELGQMAPVQRLEAVRGRWDMAARAVGASPAALARFGRELAAHAGVAAVKLRHVGAPDLPSSVRGYIDAYERVHGCEWPANPADAIDVSKANVYAVVEVEPTALSAVYPELYFLDEVAEIGADARGDAVVLLLQAHDFTRVRAILNERVRYLDGVLRIHEMMVVTMSDTVEYDG